MTDISHTTLNKDIQDAFSFTNAELVANREGHLTSAQQEQLKQKRRMSIVLVLGAIAALALIGQTLSHPAQATRNINHPILPIVIVGLFITVCFSTFYDLSRLSTDMKYGQIETIEGPVTHRITGAGRSTLYKVVVQGQYFTVTRKQLEAFVEGETYILYYMPYSKMLLTAEYVLSP